MTMKNRNWYLQRILLNFSNDGATYKAVKQIVVNNLTTKGVSCSMENGMTTLANKILDIQGGTVTYDYDVSLNLSSDDVMLGDDIVLTATLNANIDNTTVDLDGGISGATVKFYLGSTLLGTSNTNSQGVATYNYTPNTTGDYTFHSVFDGADDFDSATSSDVTVSVEEPVITVGLSASDSTILFGSSVTLTATVLRNDVAMSNETVTFYDGNTSIGTGTTDNNGIATLTKSNLTVGSHTISASSNNVTSSNVTVTVAELGDYIEIKTTSNPISTNGYDHSGERFKGTNMMIDYGDGNIEQMTGGKFKHTYATGGLHTIKIYGVSEIIYDALYYKGITEVTIPSSVTKIGNDAFSYNDNLALVVLNWTENVVSMMSALQSVSPNLVISIPYGTTSDYVAKGYPSDKLVERSA